MSFNNLELEVVSHASVSLQTRTREPGIPVLGNSRIKVKSLLWTLVPLDTSMEQKMPWCLLCLCSAMEIG